MNSSYKKERATIQNPNSSNCKKESFKVKTFKKLTVAIQNANLVREKLTKKLLKLMINVNR